MSPTDVPDVDINLPNMSILSKKLQQCPWIEIRQVHNGWVFSSEDEILAFAENDDPIETFKDLLWTIENKIGSDSSRYSEKRIKITIAHGDKYECKDKECKICHEK